MSKFTKDVKNEVNDVKKEVSKLKNQSFAYELLQEQQKQNKRLFVVVIILCFMLSAVGVYTIWLLNDITVVETKETTEYNQDIDDTGDINNSNIVNSGDVHGKN